MFSLRRRVSWEHHPKGRWYVEASLNTFAFPIAISHYKAREGSQLAIVFLFLTFARVEQYRVTDKEEEPADIGR